MFHDVTVGDYTDPTTVRSFAAGCDVVTFDHEHVPTGLLVISSQTVSRFAPDLQLWCMLRTRRSCESGSRPWGHPAPLVAWYPMLPRWPPSVTNRAGRSSRRPPAVDTTARASGGIDSADQAAEPFEQLSDGVEIIGEEFVDFARELSALVVRSPSGQAAAYPISESVQRDGICVETTTPAPHLDDDQAVAAQQLALRIADELGVVGVLAVELMQRADGSVVVNELAMRPHNTGHWTIDGAVTSQFENHLRAVLDLPLGEPAASDGWTVMANVFGGTINDLAVGACRTVLPETVGCGCSCTASRYVPVARWAMSPTFGDDLVHDTEAGPACRRVPDGRPRCLTILPSPGRDRDGFRFRLAGDGCRRRSHCASSTSVFEADVVSAHRMPDAMITYGRSAHAAASR